MPAVNVTDVFADIDCQTKAFADATGLRCKPGCGQCCLNPGIETTISEMLPLANHLWDTHQALAVTARIEAQQSQGVCVMFAPSPEGLGQGQCSAYSYRPGICRLFGFAATQMKNGSRALFTCATMKTAYGEACRGAQAYLDQGGGAPNASTHTLRVFAVDAQHGSRLMPINQALSEAIAHAGLRLQK